MVPRSVWPELLFGDLCCSDLVCQIFFLDGGCHSFGKVTFSGMRSNSKSQFWYRPYHFVQLRVLERSRPQLSKYRSKVSILSSLALIFRFAAEETIF